MTAIPSKTSPLSLDERAYNIRRHALRMGQVQGQGYVGQALGAADLLAVYISTRSAISRRIQIGKIVIAFTYLLAIMLLHFMQL